MYIVAYNQGVKKDSAFGQGSFCTIQQDASSCQDQYALQKITDTETREARQCFVPIEYVKDKGADKCINNGGSELVQSGFFIQIPVIGSGKCVQEYPSGCDQQYRQKIVFSGDIPVEIKKKQ